MEKWTRIKYQPNLPLSENGERVTACVEHVALSKNSAKEGMVLLKNDSDLLPLKIDQKVALFGKGTFDYVKGGGGSGDVTVEYTVNLYEGLQSFVHIEEHLASYYRKWVQEQYESGVEPGMVAEPELPDELCANARRYTDTAVISISRFSGESWDRSVTEIQMSVPNERPIALRSAELFEKGDFYLSNAEKAMVEKVKHHFPKVVVVLNVGGVVDTEWFAHDDRIQSVLLAWQAGMEGGHAAAELLCGIGNPSGKLTDTFAKGLTDYPSTEGFHSNDGLVFVTYDHYETFIEIVQED